MRELASVRDTRMETLRCSKDTQTWNGAGRVLLDRAVRPLSEAITDWCEKAAVKPGRMHMAVVQLSLLTADKAAFLACKIILDAIIKQRTLATLAVRVGMAIEDEVRFQQLKKQDRILWKSILRRISKNKGYSFKRNTAEFMARVNSRDWQRWDDGTRAQVGSVCIELFRSVTGLIEFNKCVVRAKRKIITVVPTEACMDWIKDWNDAHFGLTPVFLPMVEPPVPWVDTKPYSGGYPVALRANIGIVKTHNKGWLAQLDGYSMPSVYKAVNRIQSTGFRVNKSVLEVMNIFWERGLNDGGSMPFNKAILLPEKPTNIATDRAALRKYCREATSVYAQNIYWKQQRLCLAKILSQARQFKDEPTIYFPAQCDFRGRIYYLPMLNPQGTDYPRALIEFSEGRPLGAGGAEWLKIHTANAFGVDKLSFEARQGWTDKHREHILQTVADPAGQAWWLTADDPWQFLRACFEMAGYYAEGEAFVSHLPVCLDASSNGLQILSLLMRDEVGAAATNCTERNAPTDIYLSVLAKLEDRLKRDGSTGAKAWLAFGLTRSMVKHPVMTVPYGSSAYAHAQHIEEEARKICTERLERWEDKRELVVTVFWLAKELNLAIASVVRSAKECMRFLVQQGTQVSDENRAVTWRTPSGFLVRQDYYEATSYACFFTIMGKRKISLAKPDFKRVNQKQQQKALAPNFVHSLDASILHLVASKALFPMLSIHDCYAAHACNVAEMLTLTRQAFVDVFTPNQLVRFQRQLQEYTATQLVPNAETLPYGNFLLAEILKARYLFK